MSGRLVVVSNRLPPAGPGRPPPAGGLASALSRALGESGGLWFGWSGAESDVEAEAALSSDGAVEYASVDLSAGEIRGYYEGFCNRALWPLCHGFLDRARLDPAEYEVYRRVNARFADRLAALLRPGDRVWVHDYHLIPLGEELRRRGWGGRVAFFLHIPVPPASSWGRLPGAGELARALAAYELVGVQTARDAEAARALLDAHGASAAAGRVEAHPIGIDPEHWRDLAAREPANPLEPAAGGRPVLFGADRLDYSKGIPLRLEAFERLLEREPRWRTRALLVQWSAPSREAIAEYRAERERVEALAARIEARFGAGPPPDAGGPAGPVRHEIAAKEASAIAAAYREAAVSLVTSHADGMNLVAKEFVAVQRPEDPGVLVLSRGCGAAEELREALLVPAGDVDALAAAMAEALAMSPGERRDRWRALSARVEGSTVHDWSRRFLAALDAAPPRRAGGGAA